MRVTLAITLVLLAALVGRDAAAQTYRGDSIYQLTPKLTDQAGRTIGLDLFHGQPTIVTMFYGTCPGACPLLISDIRRIEAGLDEKTRAKVRVLLVSFDPDRDTPELMTNLAKTHKVDNPRWRFAAASDADARELAAVLGIKYRKLEDGNFNHSSVITLLDANGVPSGRFEGYLKTAEEPVRILEELTAKK